VINVTNITAFSVTKISIETWARVITFDLNAITELLVLKTSKTEMYCPMMLTTYIIVRYTSTKGEDLSS
jgi:hypothetical protein